MGKGDKVKMVNWKTTVSGLVLAAALLINRIAIEHKAPSPADWVTVAGFIGLGSQAKDNNVTGGSKSNRPE